MKSFRFKYTTLIWLLLIAVLIMGVIGLVWNVYSLITLFYLAPFKTAVNAVTVLFNAFFVAFVVSVMAYGKYTIKKGKIYLHLGIIRTRYDIKDIVQFTHFKKSNKLVMYFEDAKYTVIVISPEEYEQFVLAVRENKQSIIYDTAIDGEETPQ